MRRHPGVLADAVAIRLHDPDVASGALADGAMPFAT